MKRFKKYHLLYGIILITLLLNLFLGQSVRKHDKSNRGLVAQERSVHASEEFHYNCSSIDDCSKGIKPAERSSTFPWLLKMMDDNSVDGSSSDRKHNILEDIDCQLEHATCGYHKCLYPSKNDSSKGYLITTAFRKDMQRGSSLEIMTAGWYAANYFQRNYPHVSHSLLSPPVAYNLTREQGRWLGFACSTPYWKQGHLVTKYVYTQQSGRKLLVKPVRIVHQPSILVGCSPTKQAQSINAWKKFIDSHADTINVDRFLEALKSTEMIGRQFPLFWEDFQVLILADGEIMQIDTDRFFIGKDELPATMNITEDTKGSYNNEHPILVEGKAFFRPVPEEVQQQFCLDTLETAKQMLLEKIHGMDRSTDLFQAATN